MSGERAPRTADTRIVSRLMFRLLPIQILVASVWAVNGIVSGFVASNYVGIEAMSAVGLFGPASMFMTAVSTMLSGGSAILCGKYIGRNEHDKVQNLFSLHLLISALFAGAAAVLILALGLFDLTGFVTRDEAVRPLFNEYLAGEAVGILPFVLGNQLPVYLSMENLQRRTMTASLVCIVVNIALDFLFVRVMNMEAFGLALASSLGLWAFLLVQGQAFMTRKAHVRFRWKRLQWKVSRDILRIGFPGALGNGYESIKAIIVNNLLQAFVGSVAISACAAVDSLMWLFWAVPYGMLAVSRLLISISVGEEDRQTLADIMRVMFRRYVPLMCAVSAVIILNAEPFTRIFYHDPGEEVFRMTVLGFRILPLYMPLSVISLHFVCYGQASGRKWLVHVISLLDGIICVAGFTALLIPRMGVASVYTANVLNGIVCFLVIVGSACLRRKKFPRNTEQLMAIPDGFGAEPDERIDISVRSMDEVLMVSEKVTDFCRKRGINEDTALSAGLCLEEIAGNIVIHGFTQDKKRHTIDIRVVHRERNIIMLIRDDCVSFDPNTRNELTDPGDFLKNVGIRLVFRAARAVEYQSILGLNVLMIRV